MSQVSYKEGLYESLKNRFSHLFGCEGSLYFAPGRVNLIGEHTDYNGGMVFPCALSIGTYAVASLRMDQEIHFYSLNYEDEGEIITQIDSICPFQGQSWSAYPESVIRSLLDKGYMITKGMNLMFYGDIPNSSGLSSSASIEIVMCTICRDLFHLQITNSNMALLCQYAENHYIGVQCGIMDQFAIAMGKENHAVFLNTATLHYQYVPVYLENSSLIISCTNKKRGLASSKYNERRAECEKALDELKQVTPIHNLCELTVQEFEKYQYVIKDDIVRRRAKHVITENRRTIEAVGLLQTGNLIGFGQLMNESHASLRDDYEVTGKELDTLADAADHIRGVFGSRMTGAGFGGCTISLVETESTEEFIHTVGQHYEEEIGYKADFYVVSIGDGPKKI